MTAEPSTRLLATALTATLMVFLDSGLPLLAQEARITQPPAQGFLLQVSPQGGGHCVAVPNPQPAQGQTLEMQDCRNSPSQIFSYDGTKMQLQIGGLCVDADEGQAATLVKLFSCDTKATQVWKVEQKDKFAKLIGINGLCFDIRYGWTTVGAQLQVWDCGDAEPNQLWSFLPPH